MKTLLYYSTSPSLGREKEDPSEDTLPNLEEGERTSGVSRLQNCCVCVGGGGQGYITSGQGDPRWKDGEPSPFEFCS